MQSNQIIVPVMYCAGHNMSSHTAELKAWMGRVTARCKDCRVGLNAYCACRGAEMCPLHLTCRCCVVNILPAMVSQCESCEAVKAFDPQCSRPDNRVPHPGVYNYDVCKCRLCRDAHLGVAEMVCYCKKCVQKRNAPVGMAGTSVAVEAVSQALRDGQVPVSEVHTMVEVFNHELAVSSNGPTVTQYSASDFEAEIRKCGLVRDSDVCELAKLAYKNMHMRLWPMADLTTFRTDAHRAAYMRWYVNEVDMAFRAGVAAAVRGMLLAYNLEELDVHDEGGQKDLLACGDIESNPGPDYVWAGTKRFVNIVVYIIVECYKGILVVTMATAIGAVCCREIPTVRAWYDGTFGNLFGKLQPPPPVVLDVAPTAASELAEMRAFVYNQTMEMLRERQKMSEQLMEIQSKMMESNAKDDSIRPIIEKLVASWSTERVKTMMMDCLRAIPTGFVVRTACALVMIYVIATVAVALAVRAVLKTANGLCTVLSTYYLRWLAFFGLDDSMVTNHVIHWSIRRMALGGRLVSYGEIFEQDVQATLTNTEKPQLLDGNCIYCWTLACEWAGLDAKRIVCPNNKNLTGLHDCPLWKQTYQVPYLAIGYVDYIRNRLNEGNLVCWKQLSWLDWCKMWEHFKLQLPIKSVEAAPTVTSLRRRMLVHAGQGRPSDGLPVCHADADQAKLPESVLETYPEAKRKYGSHRNAFQSVNWDDPQENPDEQNEEITMTQVSSGERKQMAPQQLYSDGPSVYIPQSEQEVLKGADSFEKLRTFLHKLFDKFEDTYAYELAAVTSARSSHTVEELADIAAKGAINIVGERYKEEIYKYMLQRVKKIVFGANPALRNRDDVERVTKYVKVEVPGTIEPKTSAQDLDKRREYKMALAFYTEKSLTDKMEEEARVLLAEMKTATSKANPNAHFIATKYRMQVNLLEEKLATLEDLRNRVATSWAVIAEESSDASSDDGSKSVEAPKKKSGKKKGVPVKPKAKSAAYDRIQKFRQEVEALLVEHDISRRQFKKLAATNNILLHEGDANVRIADATTALETVEKEKAQNKAFVAARQAEDGKEVRAIPESMVAGSNPIQIDLIAVHCMMKTNEYVAFANGYLVKGPSGTVWVGTARHRYGKNNKLVECLLAPGDVITLSRPNGDRFSGPVKCTHADNDDEVWYAIECGWDVPKYGFVKIDDLLELHAVTTRRPIPVQTKYMVNEKEEWVWKSGPGTLLSCANASKIAYDVSTTFGSCRAPVFLGDGRLICGHWDGRGVLGKPNGSLCVLPPQNMNTWKVTKFNVDFYETRQVQAEPLRELEFLGYQGNGYTETTKRYPLRTDKGELHGINAMYHLMKPGTDMNSQEIQRYAEPLLHDGRGMDDPMFLHVMALYDNCAMQVFEYPSLGDFIASTAELGKLEKSAGVVHQGTQRQMIDELGDGDFEKGVEIVAQEVHDLFYTLVRDYKGFRGVPFGGPYPKIVTTPERIQELLQSGCVWSVFGKKDGYKKKKMDIGRTIQAPIFHLKVLWLVVMGENDKRWISRMATGAATWVYAGHDMDQPVSERRKARYAAAQSCYAFDMTAFDRFMPSWMIEKFMLEYIPRLMLGVPMGVMEYICYVTVHSVLRLSDGRCYRKHRGNPSGFMNTLRLNCFVSMYCWVMCLLRLSGVPLDSCTPRQCQQYLLLNYHIEVCGDDTRVWALTKEAVQLAGKNGKNMLAFWETELPWKMRVEGVVEFDMNQTFTERMLSAPPMVSRRFVPIPICGSWYLFEPLFNVSRAVKRLIHWEAGRTSELEEELIISAASSLALMVFAWMSGVLASAPIEGVLECFGTSQFLDLVEKRVHSVVSLNLGNVARIPAPWT